MQLISSNANDIQKYYEGSFVKIPELGENIFLINKVNRDGVFFTDGEGQEGVIWLHDEAPYGLDMVLPNKAMFQLGNYCYLLSRIPARQYHRGITAQNCQVKKLVADGWTNGGLSFITLKGYVNKPRYRPLVEIIETSTKGSEALSPRFAYNASSNTIWCDTRRIATVNPKLKVISCNSLLVPEIQGFVNRTCTPNAYKVVGL